MSKGQHAGMIVSRKDCGMPSGLHSLRQVTGAKLDRVG